MPFGAGGALAEHKVCVLPNSFPSKIFMFLLPSILGQARGYFEKLISDFTINFLIKSTGIIVTAETITNAHSLSVSP